MPWWSSCNRECECLRARAAGEEVKPESEGLAVKVEAVKPEEGLVDGLAWSMWWPWSKVAVDAAEWRSASWVDGEMLFLWR